MKRSLKRAVADLNKIHETVFAQLQVDGAPDGAAMTAVPAEKVVMISELVAAANRASP